MIDDLQLIRASLADVSFDNLVAETSIESNHFKLYEVKLPEYFKGLPEKWFFAILSLHRVALDPLNYAEIIVEGKRIIDTCKKQEKLPLVFITDALSQNLEQVLDDTRGDIFFMDRTQLPDEFREKSHVRDVPLITVARKKLQRKNTSHLLNPYSPNMPAGGWRFFGRRYVLNHILQSSSNCLILGSRRIGKTSILFEAFRQLSAAGYSAHYVGVQSLRSYGEIVEAFIRELSPRDAYQAQRESQQLGTNLLSSVINRLTKDEKKQIVIILDELGNVMQRDHRNPWLFFGVLRDLSHTGKVRVLASAFQEVFLQTYNDASSPLNNFGSRIEVGLFSKVDVEELIIDPLSIWYEIEDKDQLLLHIQSKFGFHPVVLQHLGDYIFSKIFLSSDKNIMTHIENALGQDIRYFSQACQDIFTTNHSLLEKYLFLKCCSEAREAARELSAVEMTQGSLKNTLLAFDILSTLEERNYFLYRLGLKGLFCQDESNALIFRVATPIVYYYLISCNNIQEMMLDYELEIPNVIKDIKITYQHEGS
ncbi:ATP-binding protein [Foetidibacter luteolus]|uniref:ATP-binding protein n=1 Tax=Foetidibacter luteolus TaxID=2608880 RepID=UPI00129A3777|nr:ATP-binding protein [Foetidibacter luteolus]